MSDCKTCLYKSNDKNKHYPCYLGCKSEHGGIIVHKYWTEERRVKSK